MGKAITLERSQMAPVLRHRDTMAMSMFMMTMVMIMPMHMCTMTPPTMAATMIATTAAGMPQP